MDACAAADGDLDGVLTINDLSTIVNAALINCG